MDEIAQIIMEKNIEKKFLKPEDIKRIGEILKGMPHYSNVKRVTIKKNGPDDSCAGDYADQVITFYETGMEGLVHAYYDLMRPFGELDGSKVEAYNFSCLSAIFHEFTHARQDLITTKDKSSLDAKLFSISGKLLNMSYTFYTDNYDNFPVEVNAYAKGNMGAYSIYKRMPKSYISSNDYAIYGAFIVDKMLDYYDVDMANEEIFGPVERLLEQADNYNLSKFGIKRDEFGRIVTEEKDMTLYRKVTLGLPLSFMEYSYINLLKDALASGAEIPFVKKLQRKI